MHILLVADGRSPITRRWVMGLKALQHRVTLVSTFPCTPPEGIEALHVLPVAFGSLGGNQIRGAGRPTDHGLRRFIGQFRARFLLMRYLLGPLSLPLYHRQFARMVTAIKPDLVHALRIPFEGMLAAHTPKGIPFIVSIWGNDLTLHAQGSPLMRRFTRLVLERADGLMADANRDIRLAEMWGFEEQRPSLVVPGGGGVDLIEIDRLRQVAGDVPQVGVPSGVPLVINPRGLRPGSLRSDVFFQAIPLVLQRWQNVRFVCPGMAGQKEAMEWVERLKLQGAVRLMPFLSQTQLWDQFLRADVMVSVSVHDGTPNSVLEAMACGCFPVVGDIESLREWITPGVNGLLVEPTKPQSLADALMLALENPVLRTQAAEINRHLIAHRAGVNVVRARVDAFYRRFMEK